MAATFRHPASVVAAVECRWAVLLSGAVSIRPFYFALYLLGAEVFAVKLGPEPAPADEARPIEGGGSTGSHEMGFVMGPDPIIIGRGGA